MKKSEKKLQKNRVMIRNKFIVLLSLLGFISGCKTNPIGIKYSVKFDESNRLIGSVNIKNSSKDTILIPKLLSFMPLDKDPGIPYAELYIHNNGSLDTIKSGNFTWSPDFDYLSTEEDLTVRLLPSNSFDYYHDIGSRYFPYLRKGKYLIKVCFEPEYNVEKDTCVSTKFKLSKDLKTSKTFKNLKELRENMDY